MPLAWKHADAQGQVGEDGPEGVFRKLLAAGKVRMQPGQRTRLQWNDKSFCCLMDAKGDLLAAAVTNDMDYPERFVYQMLRETFIAVLEQGDVAGLQEGDLNERLGKSMVEQLGKYDDYRTLLAEVQESTQDASNMMGAEPSMPGRPARSGGLAKAGIFAAVVIVVVGVAYAAGAFGGGESRTTQAEVATELRAFLRGSGLVE